MKNKKIKLISILIVGVIVVSGLSYTKSLEAASIDVDLQPWSFYQAGQYDSTEISDVAYINSVYMFDTSEVMTDWKRGNDFYFGDYSMEERTASTINRGFSLDIENAGSTMEDSDEHSFEPWEIQAKMKGISLKKGHIYRFSFSARASSRKNAYIEFENNGYDSSYPVFYNDRLVDENGRQAERTIAITEETKNFTYIFTASAGAPSINFIMNLGCFRYTKDNYGVDHTDVITDPEKQVNWKGIVDVGNFSIIDEGLSNDFIDDSDEEESTYYYPEETTTKTIPETTKVSSDKKSNNQVLKQKIIIPQKTISKLKKIPLNKKKISLKAKSSGDGRITYKSSNPRALKVNRKGVIFLKKCGKFKITIKVAKTPKYSAAKKQIAVYVIPSAIEGKITKKDGKKRTIGWEGIKRHTYEIQISKNSKFSGTKQRIKKSTEHIKPKTKVVIMKQNKTHLILNKAKKMAKRFVRIRAINSKGIKGEWSKVIKI